MRPASPRHHAAAGAELAVLVLLSGHAAMNEGAIGRTYLEIATAKSALPFWTAFFRGVLCNVLVCMAVWMTLAGRSVTDKAIAIMFPISAFVAAGPGLIRKDPWVAARCRALEVDLDSMGWLDLTSACGSISGRLG